MIDSGRLHIVDNLSCYSNGGSHCADPKESTKGKKAGIIVVGQNYQSQKVSTNLSETLSLLGFNCSNSSIFSWQKSYNMNEEQAEKTNIFYVSKYLDTKEGKNQMFEFIDGLGL